jgi:hypothetical protein
MSDEQQTAQDSQAPELEREERRLERLRLVTSNVWPPAHRFEDPDPAPDQAA